MEEGWNFNVELSSIKPKHIYTAVSLTAFAGNTQALITQQISKLMMWPICRTTWWSQDMWANHTHIYMFASKVKRRWRVPIPWQWNLFLYIFLILFYTWSLEKVLFEEESKLILNINIKTTPTLQSSQNWHIRENLAASN